MLQDAIGRVDSIQILYDKLLLSEDYKDISVKNYVEKPHGYGHCIVSRQRQGHDRQADRGFSP